tara:strand:- start:83 stop:493 length:411 start_codon:yes stop_codon:yes gene_type:complete
MKLQLKHLVPYLPYGLQCMAQGEGKQQFELQGISDIYYADLHEIGRTVCEQYDFEDTFPILRPLSDLFINQKIKDLRDLGSNDMLFWGLNGFTGDLTNVDVYKKDLSFSILEYLYKNHFDVFGLIEKGLAINVNTL